MLATALIMGGNTGAPIPAFSAHHRCQSRKKKYYKLKSKQSDQAAPMFDIGLNTSCRNLRPKIFSTLMPKGGICATTETAKHRGGLESDCQ